MANDATSDRIRWVGPATALVLAVSAARILLLAWDQKQLFVDEAQYWLWGQDLAFGYFSKPPGIGWLIRGMTELAGSDAPFWVRLPAPVLHGITAMLLGWVAARLAGGAAAIWTVAVYLTLPLVAVGSLLMTTDTLMFPFLVAGYLFWSDAVPEERPGLAALAGITIGLGFLAKYAAIYYVGAACLAALLVPEMRPSRSVALAATLGFIAAISPNVLWNVANGLITVQHTVDNIEWARDPAERLGLEWAELGEFVVAQFMVFGPLLLPVLLWVAFCWRDLGPQLRMLVLFSLPILLLVCIEAMLSRAYANWAAPAYLTGTVAVAIWLLPRARWWLGMCVAINAVLSLTVAGIVTQAAWVPEGLREATMQRYLGRAEMTEAIIALARQEGLDTVVSDDRDILADLFYTGRDAGLAFRAEPVEGRPPHHYAMSWSYDGGELPVLYVGGSPPDCVDGEPPLADLRPEDGYWSRRTIAAWQVPGSCWAG